VKLRFDSPPLWTAAFMALKNARFMEIHSWRSKKPSDESIGSSGRGMVIVSAPFLVKEDQEGFFVSLATLAVDCSAWVLLP
jgi:hypothetical protein